MEGNTIQWVEKLREEKHTLKKLTELIDDASYEIYLDLKGDTLAEKAKILFKDFKDNPKSTLKQSFYEGLKIPIPTGMRAGISGDFTYIIKDIDEKAKTVAMGSKNNPNGYMSRYTYKQLNESFESGAWELENPTQEALKRLFEVPEDIVPFRDFKADKSTIIPQYNVSHPKFNFQINTGITGNCQLCIVGNAQSMVNGCTNIKAQLKEVYKCTRKRIVLFDLKDSYIDKFNTLIEKKHIISHTKYVSTNSSNMNIILINIEKILD